MKAVSSLLNLLGNSPPDPTGHSATETDGQTSGFNRRFTGLLQEPATATGPNRSPGQPSEAETILHRLPSADRSNSIPLSAEIAERLQAMILEFQHERSSSSGEQRFEKVFPSGEAPKAATPFFRAVLATSAESGERIAADNPHVLQPGASSDPPPQSILPAPDEPVSEEDPADNNREPDAKSKAGHSADAAPKTGELLSEERSAQKTRHARHRFRSDSSSAPSRAAETSKSTAESATAAAPTSARQSAGGPLRPAETPPRAAGTAPRSDTTPHSATPTVSDRPTTTTERPAVLSANKPAAETSPSTSEPSRSTARPEVADRERPGRTTPRTPPRSNETSARPVKASARSAPDERQAESASRSMRRPVRTASSPAEAAVPRGETSLSSSTPPDSPPGRDRTATIRRTPEQILREKTGEPAGSSENRTDLRRDHASRARRTGTSPGSTDRHSARSPGSGATASPQNSDLNTSDPETRRRYPSTTRHSSASDTPDREPSTPAARAVESTSPGHSSRRSPEPAVPDKKGGKPAAAPQNTDSREAHSGSSQNGDADAGTNDRRQSPQQPPGSDSPSVKNSSSTSGAPDNGREFHLSSTAAAEGESPEKTASSPESASRRGAGTERNSSSPRQSARPGQSFLSAAWRRAVHGGGSRTYRLENGWHVLTMDLEEENSKMTVRARRSEDKVSVSVGMSDPKLRSLVAANTDRLQAALRAEYNTDIEFNLSGDDGAPTSDTGGRQSSSSGHSPGAVGGSMETGMAEEETSPLRRALHGSFEWIG